MSVAWGGAAVGGSSPRSAKAPDDSVMGQAYDARLMRRLLKYLQPYSGYAAAAVLLLILVTGVELAAPLVIKHGVDAHLTTGRLQGLPLVVIIYLSLLAAGFGLRFTESYLMQVIGQRVVFDLRTRLFDHLQRLDIKFIDSRPVGWHMTRITGDVQTLNEMFTSGIVAVFGDLFMLAGIVAIMCWVNLKLALATFLVLPLLIGLVFTFRKKVRGAFREIREALAALNGFVQEQISGVRVVQLFRREQAARERFRSHNLRYQNAFLKAIHYFAVFFPGVQFTSAVATALILVVGGLMVRDHALTWGALVAFLQYAERFFRPIRDLSEKYNTMQAAMAAAERVFWVFDSRPEVVEPERPVVVQPVKGEIRFHDVHFEYVPGQAVLKGISFMVNPGETVAIVGPTGAGKSTLFSLLLRFWDATTGAIYVDGTDIRRFRLADLRRRFGVVQQDPFLFSGSVKENVLLHREGDERLLREALAQANALDFVMRLPRAWDEPVGERAGLLSAGQRQLLVIARALACNPPILLLDEATAAVDTETERRIEAALQNLMRGRTTLVIAHRLSTVIRADRIIVIHKGRVWESGTHQELLALNGLYARLYRLQFADAA